MLVRFTSDSSAIRLFSCPSRAFTKVLALLRHVILGVLRQIAHGHGLLDLRGQLVGELVLKNLNLFEKLFLNVFGHPRSVAGSGAALAAKDESV